MHFTDIYVAIFRENFSDHKLPASSGIYKSSIRGEKICGLSVFPHLVLGGRGILPGLKTLTWELNKERPT